MKLVIENVASDHSPEKRRVHAQEPGKRSFGQKVVKALFAREHLAERRVLVVEAAMDLGTASVISCS